MRCTRLRGAGWTNGARLPAISSRTHVPRINAHEAGLVSSPLHRQSIRPRLRLRAPDRCIARGARGDHRARRESRRDRSVAGAQSRADDRIGGFHSRQRGPGSGGPARPLLYGGTLDWVPRITIDDLRSSTRRVLARDNLRIAIVGDVDAQAAGQLLDHAFGKLPAKAELTPVTAAVAQGLGRRIVIQLDVPQAVVNFRGPGISRGDPDFIAVYIVNHILRGGSLSSRLYREV